GAAGAEGAGGGGRPGLDARGRGQPGGAVVVEQVDQAEGEVGGRGGQLVAGRGEHLVGGADRGDGGGEVAQRRHPPLAEHPPGVLGDHAQQPAGDAVVVQGAVGEGVV